jgi:hypothetical protein
MTEIDRLSPALRCRTGQLVSFGLLGPTSPARNAAILLCRLQSHGLKIVRTEEADQDAVGRVVSGDARHDGDDAVGPRR